jgi:16S rRNA (cytosine967-C5)-methyltransferase
MHLSSYLISAQTIIVAYDGAVPFAAWLKGYFREHKKFGSRDRKLVSDLCFCNFRLGRSFSDWPVVDRLLAGQFLCHQESTFVAELKEEWKEKIHLPLEEKIRFLLADAPASIFPYLEEVSQVINQQSFAVSFLQQPDLFLRIRPGKEKIVLRKLTESGISFQQNGSCLQLPISTKAEEMIVLDEEAVVQDISSQQVLQPLVQHFTAHQFSAWDCCAASGGKTILLHDHFPSAKLTATDIRGSILMNLRNRLKRASIRSFHAFVADLSGKALVQQKFDVIICDAPCSGSGTWGRTPEQLCYFPKEKIDYYANLQKKIAVNASHSLKPGGYFLYITCSVFYRENEDVAEYLQQETGLKLVVQQYHIGYDKNGDTLFTALFTAL